MKENSLWEKAKDFFCPREWIRTLRAVPGLALALVTVANILMNILANKSIIELKFPNSDSCWLIQDAGIFLSWIGFLAGDLIVKNFGAKNAIRVNLTALFLSLCVSAILALISVIPGHWSPEFAKEGMVSDADNINRAINSVMGNVWYVIIGSAVAGAVGLVVNNLTQELILKRIEKKHGDHYWVYLLAAGGSTFFGQILDNFLFAALVSVRFFGWTWLTAFMCSLDGTIFELVIEMCFTPLSYAISRSWDRHHIGIRWMGEKANEEGKR